MKLKHGEPGYPKKLYALVNPPPVLTTNGPLEERRAIAIVGSRDACEGSLVFAHDLAFQLARAGIVVLSGGAVGVDGAAHRGAMAAGGATWVVSPTGQDRVYPPQHKALFEEIRGSAEHRMLWAFPDGMGSLRENLIYRNGLLAALSEGLVVVQAHLKSGSRNAVGWAASLHRPVWAVTAAPWMRAFAGSLHEIHTGRARPLFGAEQLFVELGLGQPAAPPTVSASSFHARAPRPNSGRASKSAPLLNRASEPLDTSSWSTVEKAVFSSLSDCPIHIDKMVGWTGLSVPPVATALLTLRLKDVVVEGPDGFFRRKTTT